MVYSKKGYKDGFIKVLYKQKIPKLRMVLSTCKGGNCRKAAGMIILRTIMNVLPEKQKEAHQTLLSFIEPQEKEIGYLSYGVFSDIEDKNVFNLISEWKTRKQLNHHMKSARFSVLLGTRSLLCEPMVIQILTVSDSEGIEAVNSARTKRI